MKLAISNLAWEEEESQKVYELMQTLGFKGLEIAPSKLFGADPYAQTQHLKRFKNYLLKEYGIAICSMQSIWYGRNEQLFRSGQERRELLDYTRWAIDFAETAGCGNLVFGCPKNRILYSESDMQSAAGFFRELGEYAAEHNTVLALEANPEIYGTNFINRTEEAFAFVKKVNSRGFKVNYDFGTAIYNKEGTELLRHDDNIRWVNHVHISEPYLAEVAPGEKHEELLRVLSEEKYEGYISIEMKQQTAEKVKECMKNLAKVLNEVK